MIMRLPNIRTVAIVALVAAASGCDDGLTDLNQNPNAPTTAAAEFLFPNATGAAVSRAFGSGLHMDLTALWVQHYAEFLYPTEDRYELSDGTLGGHWSGFYAGPLQDFTEVIRQGVDAERPNVAAMGGIMRSWTFHIMTDLWGDIGYSEALQGRDPSSGNTPAYDPQEQVYDGLLSELTSAQAALAPGAFSIGEADLIYEGDADRWKAFANSLRLRLAMRLSEVDDAKGRGEFAAALAAGVITGNDGNAVLRYLDDGISVHPLFAYQRNRDDHGISATLVDTLLALADPRLPVYAKPNAGGYYKGTQNGSEDDPPLDSISRIGTYFTRADAPAVLMSYAEVLFLQAEAAERGWIAGDAAALYRAAIRASMEQYGVPATDIDAYLAQPGVAYAGLPSIGVQKWIALYGNGPEAYAEWRRTGYPALVAGPDAINESRIPVRLPYPSSEDRLNGANLQAAITRQGGASLNDPLWWDRN